MAGLPPEVHGWWAAGDQMSTFGHEVYVHVREPIDATCGPFVAPSATKGPHVASGEATVVLLHGYPSSSYDWRHVMDLFPNVRMLTFDFLGFGLSDKPRGHRYSLFEQADIATEVLRAHTSGPIVVVAHDMGTSVATELMARDLDGGLGLPIEHVILFNGSVIIARASLRPIQRLMRGPLGPVVSLLANKPVFVRQLGAVFSPAHPLTPAEADAQWALLSYQDGHRQAHRLSSYLQERVRHAERWNTAVRDWPGRLDLIWGLLDPVATTNVLAGLCELRPSAEVIKLPNLGHYPHLENPPAFAEALAKLLP